MLTSEYLVARLPTKESYSDNKADAKYKTLLNTDTSEWFLYNTPTIEEVKAVELDIMPLGEKHASTQLILTALMLLDDGGNITLRQREDGRLSAFSSSRGVVMVANIEMPPETNAGKLMRDFVECEHHVIRNTEEEWEADRDAANKLLRGKSEDDNGNLQDGHIGTTAD